MGLVSTGETYARAARAELTNWFCGPPKQIKTRCKVSWAAKDTDNPARTESNTLVAAGSGVRAKSSTSGRTMVKLSSL